eukprot:PRCOL_00005151-RA
MCLPAPSAAAAAANGGGGGACGAAAAGKPPPRQAQQQPRMPPLSEIKAAIPAECFKKSLPTALFYMARDLGLLGGSFYLARAYALGNPLLLLVHALVSGFLMWCAFVVGHDCGHGTFSDSALLNAVCGHVCHAPLLVPFWPWAFSHRLHHQYHNHRVKDRSYPWFDEDEWAALGPLKRGALKSIAAPFYLFPAYLFMEAFDGCHFWPFSHLYSEGATSDRVKCVASTATVVGFAVLAKEACGSWGAFAQVYLPAYFVFAWWLFTVTYLQHHDKGTKVYDEDWTFVKGATETIDRTYGLGIDKFHHHITDGHVAHHLFSRQIPHYHLEKATAGVRSVLEPLGLYKQRDTRDFFVRVFVYNSTMGSRIERLAKGA